MSPKSAHGSETADGVEGTLASAERRANCRHVLGMRVDHIEFSAAAKLIADWAAAAPDRARSICAANVHMVMVAHDDSAYRALVNRADLVVPDGVPMVWALRALGVPQQRRVRVTPDLLIEILVTCEVRGVKVGLYGGTPQTLASLTTLLAQALPDLELAYAWSPPFGPLTPTEDAAVVEQIMATGVQLLLVGIGCPKQEMWMDAHRDHLDCVMFGVGAAFDMFAGKTGNAPAWMSDRGLEWVYRLESEPRRLWRRHVFNDPRFLVLLALQTARERHFGFR
jgi:N-acetylglucosaminyldiphosphoundecaprenol N-acetyl-beta-D-mannosaminyltransferase